MDQAIERTEMGTRAADAGDTPLLRLDDVCKTFRRTPVLDGVTLDIARGDRIALVGSNGAGKTSLIRCLLGEYTCEGTVTVDGLAPRRHRRRVLERIGFVPQLPPPLGMPVAELVRFATGVSGGDGARVAEVASRLGLDLAAVRRQSFVKLSGGQKQKLLIAIALGRDCDILVMDEPAANLDPQARHIFFALLAEVQDRATMLISSHRLDEVALLVNRVVELDRGQVVLDDHVEDAVELAGTLRCRVRAVRADDAFARALGQWGFTGSGAGLIWDGVVAGPDRLRFLAMLSRYAGLLAGLSLEDDGPKGGPAR